jgi:ABC-2 type transport system permease protein
MSKTLGIFFAFMRARILSGLQYRASFWIDTLCFVFGYGTQAALMYLLVSKFETINGWLPFEVMMLYSYVLASYTLGNSFLAGIMWDLTDKIKSGEFDQTLTKPMRPMLYEMVSSFSDYYLLHFLLALGMIGSCVANLGIVLTVGKVLLALLSIVGGALVQGGILVLFSSASFVLINNPLSGNLYNNIRSIMEYPLSILPKAVQLLLTVIIPMAFVSFFPAQHMLGKSDFLFFPAWVQYASLPVGILLFALACIVWNAAMKHYKSAGS